MGQGDAFPPWLTDIVRAIITWSSYPFNIRPTHLKYHCIVSRQSLSAISPNTPNCPDTDAWTLELEATIGNFIFKAKPNVITIISQEC